METTFARVTMLGRPRAWRGTFDTGRSKLYMVVGKSGKSKGYFPMDFWDVPYTSKFLKFARQHQKKILELMEEYGWDDGVTAIIRIDF